MGSKKATTTEGSGDGFPERLCQLRKHKNLSQTDFGRLVGLHYTHIGRYERGPSRPGADTLNLDFPDSFPQWVDS